MGTIELAPTHDIYISEAFPDRNFSTENAMFAGRYLKDGDIYRSLMKFDIAGLKTKAKDAKILSAKLKVTIFRNEIPPVPGRVYIRAYRLVEGYEVNTVTWNTQPRTASYPVSTAIVRAGFKGDVEIDITPLVRGWYYGTMDNYGIVLRGNEVINSITAFSNSRAANESICPKLLISFAGDIKADEILKTFRSEYDKRLNYNRSLLDSPFTEQSKEIVSKIKDKKYRGIVVYPQAVFWEPMQRPHHMLRELARRGYLCFFCAPPSDKFMIKEVEDNLFVVNNEAYLLPVLRAKFVIILCTWLMQMAWAELVPNKFIWYDVLDQIESFAEYDDDMMERHEIQLEEADFISYSSNLLKRYAAARGDAVYLPNACNPDDFIKMQTTEVPEPISRLLEMKKPIIGYFGAVEEWFDDKLVKDLAVRNPDWQFVIIGKTNIDRYKLKAQNIHLMGMVPYNSLPDYAIHFNVAIIPFKVNDLTNCVSPVKFFEYASLGKPVVSTPIMEMGQYKNDWVRIAGDVESFEMEIKACLSEDVKKTAIDKGMELALQNRWYSRVEAFEARLKSNPKGWLAFSNIHNTGEAAVMASTFLDFEGKNFYSGGAERYLIDLAGICDSLALPFAVYQYGNFPWTRRFRNIYIHSLSTGDFDASVLSMERVCRFNRIFYELTEKRTLLNIYSAFFEGYPYISKPSIGISHGIAWDHPYCNFNSGESFWNNHKRFIEAARSCDTLVSVDTNTPNWFQTIVFPLGSNMKYIPNYVDPAEFSPREGFDTKREKTVILYPRRIYEARGFYMVIEIMDSILQQYPDVEFHFVGRGMERDTSLVEEKQEEWGGRVKWYFKMPEEMPGVYKEGDITLVPTLYSEGTSLSCLEAMASGNAVIATRIGGLTNLVIDNYNGYLIEPNTDALKTALENLLNDHDKLTGFKRKGIEVSKAFSKESWKNKWANIIKGSIGETEKPVTTRESLVEIYIDSLSDWRMVCLGELITGLLAKGCLVYIKARDSNGFKTSSFGRAQWVPWDEEDISKPDIILADEEAAENIKGTKNINFLLTEPWLEGFASDPEGYMKPLGIE